jgi:hypothetical protein
MNSALRSATPDPEYSGRIPQLSGCSPGLLCYRSLAAIKKICLTPDDFKQKNYDGNNQQNMNDPSRMENKKSEHPSNNENHCN